MGETEITCAAGTIVGEVRDNAKLFDAIPFLEKARPFDAPVPLKQGLLIDATAPHPNALSISAPLGARAGTDFPVIVWLSAPADLGDGFVHVHVPHRDGFEGFLPFAADAIGHFRGVADVQLALRWIQRNIEAFGGDPTNVTVVGAGEEAAVALWLCRRDHYAGEFRRVWAADPVFPRAPYEKRKWIVRYLLSAPLTRAKLNELAENRPGRVGRSYRRYAKFFGPMGPHPHDASELAELAVVRVEDTLDPGAIAEFAR
ncbi:carboxylesterase family protein [Corynebacterium sp. MSK008]|uniref:carboxylesterase family protein n=1 Tax=Corynebacterium sp. MSK008 TaxID=3050188 RepID=UPI00254FB102|nr:carboxylesterase family protein [Corynebacterium sp. MSK008]MDK8880011.1 carboxylesterase family protein [Corynebacterium sp. MSK008]